MTSTDDKLYTGYYRDDITMIANLVTVQLTTDLTKTSSPY